MKTTPVLIAGRKKGAFTVRVAFWRRCCGGATPERLQPNLHIFAAPGDVRGYYPGYSLDSLRRHDRFSWLVLEAHTSNRDGRVTIQSDDPFLRPEIQFRYFDENDPWNDPELNDLVAGIHFVRNVLTRMRLSLGAPVVEVWPGPSVSRQPAALVVRAARSVGSSCVL